MEILIILIIILIITSQRSYLERGAKPSALKNMLLEIVM